MKITYIHHSSFSVELERSVLLFDYFEGEIPEFDPEKSVYVFASHKHHDHYDKKIFELAERYPHILFILSGDICMNSKYMDRIGIPNPRAGSDPIHREKCILRVQRRTIFYFRGDAGLHR